MRFLGLSFLIPLFCLLQLPTVLAEDADDVVDTTSNMSRLGGQLAGFTPLMVGEESIPALFLEQTLGEPRGAILLLHDLGENMDSSTLSAIRSRLPASGWDTLSVALNYDTLDAAAPAIAEEADAIVADEAPVPEVPPQDDPTSNNAPVVPTAVTNAQRIDAALDFLQTQGSENIIILGHGQAGELALAKVTATAIPIAAVVMLGTGKIEQLTLLTDANLPILEIYGSRHDPHVIKAIEKRQVAMKMQETQPYVIRQIDAADRAFTGTLPKLVKMVHSWLHRQLIEEPTD